MLCDHCTINANCEKSIPNSVCSVEKEAFEQLVKELTKHYKLDMVADRPITFILEQIILQQV